MSSEPQARLHALDGLRGTMMLLGLVFHGACSYVTTDITKVWPYHDAAQSPLADILMSYLHAFRMPIFFVLAGFFAAMMLAKRAAEGCSPTVSSVSPSPSPSPCSCCSR